jgi:hypothetical protein
MGLSNRLKILIAVAVTVVVAVAIVVPVVLLHKKDDSGSIEPQRSNSSKLLPDEVSRIDCFLDAESPFENLTKYSCEKRGCIYKPNVSNNVVPKCYFDRENLGYKLKSQNNMDFDLTRSGKSPFPGEINNIRLSVEFLGKKIVRVKVKENKFFNFI